MKNFILVGFVSLSSFLNHAMAFDSATRPEESQRLFLDSATSMYSGLERARNLDLSAMASLPGIINSILLLGDELLKAGISEIDPRTKEEFTEGKITLGHMYPEGFERDFFCRQKSLLVQKVMSDAELILKNAQGHVYIGDFHR